LEERGPLLATQVLSLEQAREGRTSGVSTQMVTSRFLPSVTILAAMGDPVPVKEKFPLRERVISRRRAGV
jgi:hypothetical protein